MTTKLDVEEILQKLESSGSHLKSRDRLPNNLGEQFRFDNGEIVNVYDNGTVDVQGKNREAVMTLLGLTKAPTKAKTATAQARNVFVVYGHDEEAKTQLEAMLRRWKLEPIILDQLPSEGQTIIEKLEKYRDADVAFAVVLATPDDEGYPTGKADEKRFRARQNVVLELGVMLTKLGRNRVAILLKNQKDMERPSDIQGLIYIPFIDKVDETKVQLAKEMEKQGIVVQVSRL